MTDVIAQIDAEIAKLQQAKALLGSATTAVVKKTAVKAKRKLSPEGRKAIADAMKRRWAERRKQAAK